MLTLMIVAVVMAQLVRGQEVELLWTETLMIALAHYFTSRRFIKLPPERSAGWPRKARSNWRPTRSFCPITPFA